MSVIPERDTPADYISVHDFAIQYRVDESVIRGWIKQGHICYVLVGPRMMRRIRKSDVLKPIEEGNNGQTGQGTTERDRTDVGGEQGVGAQGDTGSAGRPAPVAENKGRHRGTASGSR